MPRSFVRVEGRTHQLQRPTALITKGMIEKARTTIEELGFTSALDVATPHRDITINNILFGTAGQEGHECLRRSGQRSSREGTNLDKIETVSIEDFLANVLPKAESLEVMLRTVTPQPAQLDLSVDPTAKTMFKWPNNFCWSYAGELADSIKERVKRAGGAVDGDLRCSLSWFNYDDLDLHLIEPEHLARQSMAKRSASATGGQERVVNSMWT